MGDRGDIVAYQVRVWRGGVKMDFSLIMCHFFCILFFFCIYFFFLHLFLFFAFISFGSFCWNFIYVRLYLWKTITSGSSSRVYLLGLRGLSTEFFSLLLPEAMVLPKYGIYFACILCMHLKHHCWANHGPLKLRPFCHISQGIVEVLD